MTHVLETVSSSTKQWWYNVRQNALLLAWNLSTFLSVLVPLVVYSVCHARRDEEDGSQDDNNNNGWTWWWNNNNDDDNNNNNGEDDENNNGWWYNLWYGNEEERREEEQGSGALVFVYLWTLVMFLAIVYYGHQHIRNSSTNKNFLLALCMFANLSFVACILVGANMRGMEERAVEEYGFFGLFAGCMVVTYALWTFLCSVFCGILYKPSNQKEYDSSASDYQRQTDDDNKNTWWGAKKKQESTAKQEEQGGGGWMSGWTGKEETTASGIKVKTQDEGPMAPLECFGSEKSKTDEQQGGTMA